MNILLWIVFGALAGWIASLVMHRNERQGILGDILLGVVGAFLGGFVVSLLGGSGITGFNIYSLGVAILGAIAVVWIGRQMYSYK